jgi:hypothetical protein
MPRDGFAAGVVKRRTFVEPGRFLFAVAEVYMRETRCALRPVSLSYPEEKVIADECSRDHARAAADFP